jgi:hypothetical protein
MKEKVGNPACGTQMTELVVGKKLTIPPSKDAAAKATASIEPGFQMKVQFSPCDSMYKKSQSILQCHIVPSVAQTKSDLNCKSCVDSGFDSNVQEQALETFQQIEIETAPQKYASLNGIEQSPMASLPRYMQHTSDSLENAAHGPLLIVDEKQDDLEQSQKGTAQAEHQDHDETPSDDGDVPELNTDTTLGLSVAILMGKSVPKHKNIFDLMDSSASTWIKKSLGKNSISSMLLEKKRNEALLEAKEKEQQADVSADDVNEVQSLKLPSIEIRQPSQPSLEIGGSCKDNTCELYESSAFPPIFADSSVFKRERRGAKSPPVLHNYAIKETYKLRFENLKMGEGRFAFDDIEAKTKEQLIQNLRQTGDKTDFKELQKKSESNLRIFLKERQESSLNEVKFKSDGNLPFFRIEQMLSRRAPETKCPSPETIKKWHATAKKAGVPIEALTRFQGNLTCDQAAAVDPVESTFKRAEIAVQRAIETKVKPVCIPRIVNPDHMELLLSQSPPKPYTQSPTALSMQVPMRMARNDILWKMLCALE